jgi:hypothetical protein
VASGTKDWFQGKAQISEDKAPGPEEELPPRASRKAWGQLQGKPQTGLALFSVKGNYAMPVYINLVDVRGGGKEMVIYFQHMTVKIVGRGLEELADGIRRQVSPTSKSSTSPDSRAGRRSIMWRASRLAMLRSRRSLGAGQGKLSCFLL